MVRIQAVQPGNGTSSRWPARHSRRRRPAAQGDHVDDLAGLPGAAVGGEEGQHVGGGEAGQVVAAAVDERRGEEARVGRRLGAGRGRPATGRRSPRAVRPTRRRTRRQGLDRAALEPGDQRSHEQRHRRKHAQRARRGCGRRGGGPRRTRCAPPRSGAGGPAPARPRRTPARRRRGATPGGSPRRARPRARPRRRQGAGQRGGQVAGRDGPRSWAVAPQWRHGATTVSPAAFRSRCITGASPGPTRWSPTASTATRTRRWQTGWTHPARPGARPSAARTRGAGRDKPGPARRCSPRGTTPCPGTAARSTRTVPAERASEAWLELAVGVRAARRRPRPAAQRPRSPRPPRPVRG